MIIRVCLIIIKVNKTLEYKKVVHFLIVNNRVVYIWAEATLA